MTQKNKGVCCILLSSFSFALMNMFVRMSGDLPSIQKSFFRNFVAMLFALSILLKEKPEIRLDATSKKFLLLRSLCGTIGILCNFYAVDHLVLADASMLNKMSPFFAILFGILILKEKINPLIGSAGVSAVPMAARVSQKVGQDENPANFLLMHAMGPNVAGVIGSAVAAGFLLALFGQ